MVDTKSMKNPSFVLNKVKDVTFEERPVPEIKDPHYVKINVKKTGICGSDVHYYVHGAIGDFVVKSPMVLGHESAGTVVEVGSAVTSLKVGDNVAMEPGIPSRYSDEYKQGRYNLCPHMAFAATPPYDGTLARYYLLPEDFCVKLPEGMSLEEGALVEPTSVGVHVCKLGNVRPGSIVAVFGCGPVGQLAIACAKAFGAAKVVGIDISEDRLNVAKTMGATHTFLSKGDPRAAAQSIGEVLGEQPDIVLECSGAEPSIAAGIHALKSGGTFVQAGNGKPDVSFPISAVCNKELQVKGSFRYGYGDYKLATHLIASGQVKAKTLISHEVDFENAEEAFKLVMSGKAMKVIINGPQ